MEQQDSSGEVVAVGDAVEIPTPKKRAPRALKVAMERLVVENRMQKPTMPRRLITFTIDHDVCAPGVFDEDIDVTIGSLTPAMELRAAEKARGEIASLAFHYARLSLVAVNGTPLDPGELEDEWLWEALGSAGRQIVMGMFAQCGAPSPEAQGKALRSLRVDV